MRFLQPLRGSGPIAEATGQEGFARNSVDLPWGCGQGFVKGGIGSAEIGQTPIEVEGFREICFDIRRSKAAGLIQRRAGGVTLRWVASVKPIERNPRIGFA